MWVDNGYILKLCASTFVCSIHITLLLDPYTHFSNVVILYLDLRISVSSVSRISPSFHPFHLVDFVLAKLARLCACKTCVNVSLAEILPSTKCRGYRYYIKPMRKLCVPLASTLHNS